MELLCWSGDRITQVEDGGLLAVIQCHCDDAWFDEMDRLGYTEGSGASEWLHPALDQLCASLSIGAPALDLA
jgi:hypothetical protein